MIEQALELKCSHVFFLDDDIAVQPDTLMKLLKHDVDIVSGLYLKRNYPHRPIVFNQMNARGECKPLFPQGINGLTLIDACGLGCVLIKTSVFGIMRSLGLSSGYQCNNKWITLGELESDQWCDDISFFRRAKMTHFKVYCDLSCMVGHFATALIWPNQVSGQWFTTYDTFGSDVVSAPQVNTLTNKKELANAT
jgi:hypothetical protein